jgi:5-methylcytosine-specific restriction endonuclease McrA
MERAAISSWIRQARYRAKRQDIYSDLEIADVEEIVEHYKNNCAYCGNTAETLDHPFPLKTTAPNVPANVLLSCKTCKTLKKNNDLVWMFSSGHLKQENYLELLQQMFGRKGGDTIKEHVRQVTGIVGDS